MAFALSPRVKTQGVCDRGMSGEMLEERRDYELLYQIAHEMLSPGRDLAARLELVLGRLAEHGMERGIIAIHDPVKNEIAIELSHGLSPSQRRRGRYRPGEGVVGRVLERGEPFLISRIGDEPRFLDRTCSRKELDWSNMAFVCVPITATTATGTSVIGTLSVDRAWQSNLVLEDDLRLLTVIAMIIGDAVRNYRDHREELLSVRREKEQLASQVEVARRPEYIIGTHHAMVDVFKLIENVAPTETSVLIRGESGTGKELVAQAVHAVSRRKDRTFVSVNCAALPEQLVASELFGHVRGAYTGADNARKGRFELADGGTIFLDEIGEISPTIQVKLLRILQGGELDRLGDEKSRRVDVRVIAATNASLERAIDEGRFRQDLYYRLNVFPIYLPPLRERKSDIMLLADHFVDKYARIHGREVARISTPAIELLTSYHWPGNVRELENCISRAVLLTRDGAVRAHHLPPSLQTGGSSGTTKCGSLEEMMMSYEREILIEAMKNASGNQARAARALATTPRILTYRLRKHGLHEQYRTEE